MPDLLVGAAKSRATTPEALVEEFAHSPEQRRVHVEPLTAEEFFHELDFGEDEIAEIAAALSFAIATISELSLIVRFRLAFYRINCLSSIIPCYTKTASPAPLHHHANGEEVFLQPERA